METKLRGIRGFPREPCVQDPPIICDASALPEVPVINMQNLLSGDSMELELQKLHNACKEWGFFQLINHGVSTSLVEKAKSELQEFFNLPIEELKKLGQGPGDREGFKQAFVASEGKKLHWADLLYMVTIPTSLRKPHLLSSLPIPFRDTIEAYSAALNILALKILNHMAKALEMKAEDMRVLFEEGTQSMRLHYYPPFPHPELVTGLTPHTDADGLTIVLQVNEMEGLQIKKDGVWIPIIPLPNAFIVNIGDILEIMSNGIYQSMEHGATVNSEKEMYFIATFLNPKLDGELGPAPSLVTAETPAIFRRIGVAEYFRGCFSRELYGKSYMDVLRIQNEDGHNN